MARHRQGDDDGCAFRSVEAARTRETVSLGRSERHDFGFAAREHGRRRLCAADILGVTILVRDVKIDRAAGGNQLQMMMAAVCENAIVLCRVIVVGRPSICARPALSAKAIMSADRAIPQYLIIEFSF